MTGVLYWLQVSYIPSCQLNPCVNNGSCVVTVQSDWTHYKCLCPELGRPLGTNCEFLAICDTLPCLNGGTCVNLENQSSYECMCHDNYMGQNCETPISIAPMLPQRQYNIPSTSTAFGLFSQQNSNLSCIICCVICVVC